MGLGADSPAGPKPEFGGQGHWRLPAVLILVSLLPALAGDTARRLLRYERSEIAAGELWRLLTGHFVHLGMTHYVLNVAGLALVWLLAGRNLPASGWLFVIALSIAGIDLGFWFLDTGLAWYVGLSGLLHGMLTAGILAGWRRAPLESAAIAVVIVAKLAWEQLVGPMPGSESTAGGPVVVNAHLYGAISGLVAALLQTGAGRRVPI